MKQLVILLPVMLAVFGLAYKHLPERDECAAVSPLSLPRISNDTPGLMLDLPDGAGTYRYMDASTDTTKQFYYAGKTRDWNARNARAYCAYLDALNGRSCEFHTEEGARYALVDFNDNYIMEVSSQEVNVTVTLVQGDGTHIEIFPIAGGDRNQAGCNHVRALRQLGAGDS